MGDVNTKYSCADCGKLLSVDERPCSKCGGSKRRIHVEIHEIIELTKKLEEIEDDVSILYNKLCKAVTPVIVIIGLLIASCMLPLFFYSTLVVYERVLYASIGVLTFISIFYALLISSEGRGILNSIEKLIKSKEKKLRELAIADIEKSKDTREMLSNFAKVEKELKKVSTVKNTIDIEYMLIIVVFVLLLSIIFTLFNHFAFYLCAYVLFSFGVAYSGAIVLEWRLLRKISEQINLTSQ